MAKNYINKNKLLYHIILSKGRGKLTPEAQIMLIQIVNGVIKTKAYNLIKSELYEDVYQGMVLQILMNWNKFDHIKYDNPFAYFSEISKREMAGMFNYMKYGNKIGKKYPGLENFKMISLTGIHTL